MSSDVKSAGRYEPELDGTGMRIAIVCGRFNDHVTQRLLDGARRGLATTGVADDDVTVVWVPGSFEVPVALKAFAMSGEVDAVIGVGCVIRGETSHYDLVGAEAARGIQQVQLETGVPAMFGVLTTEDLDQALARSEDEGGHNVGEECGRGAVEMVTLLRAVREKIT
jgi:6,7-dimethyl-8-ribityllumazine synthase